jgi:hypothetical protein
MDSMATISQDSSVFTITPKTVTEVGEGAELTGSITFRATDGVNILPYVSSFTLSFITVIENSRYTTLLATATGTSDNNNITDASTNNHTITVNGDAHAGTFSPYRSGGYSWDFQGAGFYTNDNGHGESIEAENTASAFNVGTNDYTIEGWFKERDSETYSTNPYARLFDLGPNDNISLMRNYPNTGGKKLLLKENSSVIITSTNDVFDGNWHFIQVVRTGGYTKLYVDGTEEGSIASTTNINAISKIIVGAWSDYSYGFDGQIADFRFSNIARSAGVPTERLTSDSNTKLLVCTKPYLVDESGTATSLILLKSANGTRDYPDAVAISPYDYLEYDAADHGGSVYFDGTGDYLVASNNTDTFGTGDFTLEGWIYRTATGATWQSIVSQRNGASTSVNEFVWGMHNSGYMYFYTGAHVASTAAGVIKLNQWHHIAFTRSGSTLRQFVDGIQQVSGTSSNNLTYGPMSIGNNNGGSELLTAFLSDIKTTKGTAFYTSNFTPPTEPISSANSLLHIKGTDASIIDKSQGANLKLFGTTTGSTGQVRTGDWANTKTMYFDGNSDYITIPNNELYGFGTGDWTIETWLYCTKTGGFNAIFDTRVGSGTQSGNFGIGMYNTGRVQLFSGGIFYYPTNTLSFNTWQHFAVVKNSGTTTMYFNGTAASSTYSDSRDYGSSQPVQIGKDDTASNYFGGYMQDFRITKDLARYAANFTPPSAPLEG